MPTLQLSGLASGFDWKSLVDQLITLERVPQNRLRTEKTQNQSKLTGFGDFRTKLTSLQDAAKALTSDSLFAKRSLSVSNPDLNWTATAADAATAGDFAFSVTKLATRSLRTGASDIADPVNASNDVSGLLVSEMRIATPITTGSFSVNGQQVEVETDDTLQDVFDKINTATGGDVTASYDSATDRITLSGIAPPSGPDVVVELGGGADTSNFLFATKLYNNGATSVASAASLGAASLFDSIATSGLKAAVSAVDGNGDGSFSINGVAISFNVNDDSLQNVITRVNSSQAGVTMGYDAVNDRFTVTNKKTGDLGLSVTDTPGGLLEAMGLATGGSVTRGVNAEFSVDGGGTIVSASNTLDQSAHGISGLTVTASSLGSQTISVAGDTDGVDSGVRSFIDAFNAVQTFIDDQTQISVGNDGSVSSALFANNREFTDIARKLRSTVFDEVPGLTGSIRRLEAIGIDFDGSSSKLAIKDEAKLAEALANNLEEVTALFTTPTTGLSATLDTYLSQITNSGGLIESQEQILERQNQSLDTQIADIERRLEAERTRLEESFIRMEQAQSLIQSQLASLQSTLNIG